MKTEIYLLRDIQTDDAKLKAILSYLNTDVSHFDIQRLKDFLLTLRDDLLVSVETDYVDAMYRDEYYHFYATKLHPYSRNCLKLSFFKSGNLEASRPVDYSKADAICKDYLGFLVLRPLSALIGRNVIAPEAKKHGLNDIEICRSHVQTTALGLKVKVDGFPHASQDGEMMACAETTLWSISEYYGNKYPGYKPILPSEILEAMRPTSHQRQLPSRGLTFDQISYGFNTFGFCPKIYQLCMMDSKTKKPVMNEEMKEVFTCYIESGFPLAICLQSETIGHAVVCVGRNKQDRSRVEKETINSKNYFVWNRSIKEFVFNDDNYPCYQKTNIEKPTAYYNRIDWNDVRISSFMVPLPRKVYMDAYTAIRFSKNIMVQLMPENTVVKTYLASSRSFRDHLANSKTLSNDDKALLLSMELPRFVWVSEYTDRDSFEKGIINNIMIIDATEMSDSNQLPIILLMREQQGYAYNPIKNTFEMLVLPDRLSLETYNKNII